MRLYSLLHLYKLLAYILSLHVQQPDMRKIPVILALIIFCAVLSCTKNKDSGFNGKTLHAATNYQDSLIIDTVTYSILYEGLIYTSSLSSTNSSGGLLNVMYNGTHITDAMFIKGAIFDLHFISTNSTFRSDHYFSL